MMMMMMMMMISFVTQQFAGSMTALAEYHPDFYIFSSFYDSPCGFYLPRGKNNNNKI